MRRSRIRTAPAAVLTRADLLARFAQIRAQLGVPTDFPAPVLAEAAAAGPDATDAAPAARDDLTDLPFVTLDPPGATDLDQAMHLRRTGAGFSVDYAIADVPAWVDAAGAVAAEALRRGQTIYCPDGRIPLHPPVLSEQRASLLPDGPRPAFVWRFSLDADGDLRDLTLSRAMVRSRAQLDYPAVQRALDGNGPAELADLGSLLREIGTRRQALELARGGASLPLPEQEVAGAEHGFALQLRPPRPVEDWNAQLSLLTGMAAAQLMLQAGVGLLRTLPAAEPQALVQVRTLARQVGVGWPDDEPYGALLRRLNAADPRQLAVLHAAGSLFRGADYLPFDADTRPPADQLTHAAVAAPYAHVTAPLRRLVDRFGLLAAWSAASGAAAPVWLTQALPQLPGAMAASDRLAGEVDRQCIDTVEAATLADQVGQVLTGVVVRADRDGDGGRVQLDRWPVLARCEGAVQLGEQVRVRVRNADPSTGDVLLAAL